MTWDFLEVFAFVSSWKLLSGPLPAKVQKMLSPECSPVDPEVDILCVHACYLKRMQPFLSWGNNLVKFDK